MKHISSIASTTSVRLGVLLAATAPAALAQTGSEGVQDPNLADLERNDSFYFQDETDVDDRFDGRQIVHPVTAPNYHDDAYITTDVRATYLYHKFPLNDQEARIFDLQARYALTDDFQLLVSKFGQVDVHFDNVNQDHSGNDTAFGFKFAPLQNWEDDVHLAFGATYEIGTGENGTSVGDDEFRVFAAYSGAEDRVNYGLNTNVVFSTEGSDVSGDSDWLSVHGHIDYTVNEYFSPVVELNYYHVFDEGSPVTSVSGVDLANLGGNKSEDVLTVGIGGEIRPLEDLAVRAAYETPLSDTDDLFNYRWTVSLLWRF